MGRSKKTWHEKARIKLWAVQVYRLKEGMSVDQLNLQFAYKEPLTQVEKLSKRKVFQGMRDKGAFHRGGDQKLRSLEDVIEVVDKHPNFRGTAAFFNSKLWGLLLLQSISEAEILKRIDDLFIEYGVQRYPHLNFKGDQSGRNPGLDYMCPINPPELLGLARAHLPTIDSTYWSLLISLHFRTSIKGWTPRIFDDASRSLTSYFEGELGDAAHEFTPHLLKWIEEIQVVRVF